MADVNFRTIGSPKANAVNTIIWETLTSTNSAGTAYESAGVDRTVQFTGTFGGATAKLLGSNDGTTYATLNDLDGSPLELTSAGLRQIAEFTRYIKPDVATNASGTTDVDCFITEHGS